ncbi:hypothetical protein FIU87_02505 [Bacillus sp. THAF10]|nr:hypothetical protein FIU87_02505 [Bacillus sp. THAF10]
MSGKNYELEVGLLGEFWGEWGRGECFESRNVTITPKKVTITSRKVTITLKKVTITSRKVTITQKSVAITISYHPTSTR